MEEGGFGIKSGALGIRYIGSCRRLVFPFIGFAHGEETTHLEPDWGYGFASVLNQCAGDNYAYDNMGI